mmetsp:Transcript_17841/g.43662  ORF Transcript_17841/g.43662 Transcript_17841/m.43662 type:complete len:221 (-) Transcript_17841:859-1521(-)
MTFSTALTTCSGWTIVAASSSSAKAVGTSWLERRMTLWSSMSKKRSWISAEREAPMPPVSMHSSTMIALFVLAIEFFIVWRSNGLREIRSMTSGSYPRASRSFTASMTVYRMRPYVRMVMSFPVLTTSAFSRLWTSSGPPTVSLRLYRRTCSKKTIGLSLRMAALRRALAFRGVLTATSWTPGIDWKYDSRRCECSAPSCRPTPPGPRMTIGTLYCPPEV